MITRRALATLALLAASPVRAARAGQVDPLAQALLGDDPEVHLHAIAAMGASCDDAAVAR